MGVDVTRLTSRDLKRTNRSRLLNLLYFNAPTSRFELSQLSDLSPATVTKIIGELIDEQIVIETGVEDSQGGRPRTTLIINPEYGYFIGVDVGETHIYVELFDIRLHSLSYVKYTLSPEENHPEDVTRYIVQGVRALLSALNIPDEKVLGVGIGVPGMVDRSGGVSIFAPNWGWQNIALQDLLRRDLKLPILLDNGAQAMALAEMWFGAGAGGGLVDLVVLLIGTGIGAGVIADGKLYRGASNSAGEWGHTCIELDGRECRCGSHGCIEAYAGAPAIIQRIRELDPDSSILTSGVQIEIIRALQAAAGAGDALATQVLNEVAHTLGAGIANLINLFNPQLIVLGGWSGAVIGETILPQLQQVVRRYALPQPLSAAKIALSQLGWDAVSIGAASLALEQFLMGESPRKPVEVA